MWGEGASDLWRRLEGEEDEREAELIEAVRERLRSGSGIPETGDDVRESSTVSLVPAA